MNLQVKKTFRHIYLQIYLIIDKISKFELIIFKNSTLEFFLLSHNFMKQITLE